MRRIRIFHQTRYAFPGKVTLGPHALLVRPREGHNLRIESSKLHIDPSATLRWHSDAFDNSVAVARFEATTNELTIDSEVIVQHYDDEPFDFIVADHAVDYPFGYSELETNVLFPFLARKAESTAAVQDWVASVWRPGERIQTFGLLTRLNMCARTDFTYQAREWEGVQRPDETIARRAGSCRDFANLFIQAVRSLGLAARFVSGYLNTPTMDPYAGATHAWSEVYIPGAGWKGFDPTIGELVGNKHIPVAIAGAAEHAPPVSGSYFGSAGASLYVKVDVSQIA